MPYTNTLKVFEKLRPAFDEKQATAVAEAIDEALETNNDALLQKFEAIIDVRIANLKAELIKWMFIFIVGQTTVTIGVIIAVLQLFFK